MKFFEEAKNLLSEFEFKPDQTLNDFIESKMKDELALVENLTQEQLQEIIKNKVRPRAKTVYYGKLFEKSVPSSNY
jgi:sporulation-control protein spo0M